MEYKVVRPSTEESGDIIDPYYNDVLQQSYEMAEEATPKPTNIPKVKNTSFHVTTYQYMYCTCICTSFNNK